MEKIFCALGNIGSLVSRQVEGSTEKAIEAFTKGLQASTSADKPTKDEWVEGSDALVESILEQLPDGEIKTEVTKLFADMKEAVLAGLHAKGFQIFLAAIKIIADFKALSHDDPKIPN